MKRNALLSTLITLCFPVLLFAQGELEQEDRIFLRNELSGALFLSSNGYGLNLLYGKRLDGYRKTLYSASLAEVKHPKETRTTNPYLPNNNRFVFGKINNFYTLRAGMGLQREVYSKRDKNSISIRYFYMAGASVGVLKPVYYKTITTLGFYAEINTEKFDPDRHMQANIVSRASYFKGFDELKFSPGGFIKAGVMFEFSDRDALLRAVEGGVIADFYMRGMKTLAVDASEYNFLSKIEENNHVFLGMYISYRFGKVIEAKGFRGQMRQ